MSRLYMVTESILLNFIFWSILYQAECHAAILAQNQGKTEVHSKFSRPPYNCRTKKIPQLMGSSLRHVATQSLLFWVQQIGFALL